MAVSEGFKGWVAGFVDGDGTVTVHKQKHSVKQGLVHTAYYVLVAFQNTRREALEAIQLVYKGRLRPHRQGEWGGCLVYHLVIAGKQAVILLKDIEPYLILKREQAQLCLQLADSIARCRYQRRSAATYISETEWRLREELYLRVRNCNRRGKEREIILEDFFPSPAPNAGPQLSLFGVAGLLVERGEADFELATQIARSLHGKSANFWDAVRVARLAPQLGVDRAVSLLLPGG